jgi:hypothetical protein
MHLNVTMMTRTALIVKRLREAGASCICKTNTPGLQELPSLCGMKVQDKAFKEEFGGISCE